MRHKNFTLKGFCPGGFVGGICPGGFCPRTQKTNSHFEFLNQIWHVYWPMYEILVLRMAINYKNWKLPSPARTEICSKKPIKLFEMIKNFNETLRFPAVLMKNHRKWAKKWPKIDWAPMNKSLLRLISKDAKNNDVVIFLTPSSR